MERFRIPRTATRRGAICWARLLERVDPNAIHPKDYHGRHLRPGQSLELADLPVGNLIVLESTEAEAPAKRARDRRSWESLYILWRYDREKAQWVEISRIRADAFDWAERLRGEARIALGRESWSIAPKVTDTVDRLRNLIDRELGALDRSQKARVLAYLCEELDSWLLDRALTVTPAEPAEDPPALIQNL